MQTGPILKENPCIDEVYKVLCGYKDRKFIDLYLTDLISNSVELKYGLVKGNQLESWLEEYRLSRLNRKSVVSPRKLKAGYDEEAKFSRQLMEFEKIIEGLLSQSKAGFGIASRYNFDADMEPEKQPYDCNLNQEPKHVYMQSNPVEATKADVILDSGEENIEEEDLDEGFTGIGQLFNTVMSSTGPLPLNNLSPRLIKILKVQKNSITSPGQKMLGSGISQNGSSQFKLKNGLSEDRDGARLRKGED